MATKLELTWIGKEEEIKIEPRILVENPDLSNEGKGKGARQTTLFDQTVNCDNMLIHGDNLLALKSLEQEYAGKIRCIYIDPPYNTGSAFKHYDDSVEHSLWLNLMKQRLVILRNLLDNDKGSIWISIDDDERDYLKILCDEIFGRSNFVCSVIWQKKFAPQNDAKWLSDNHDYVLVYAKNKDVWRPNLLPRSDEANSRYKNPDNDPRGPWTSGDISVKRMTEKDRYEITTPSGRKVMPPDGTSWRLSKETFDEYVADNRIWFGPDGNNTPRIKRFLSEVKDGITSMTIWTRDEVGDNQEAKREVKLINSEDVFDTPKPERLIQKIVTLASDEGDIVLDSFLGSGTTAAVAHKMNRRWIGIEMGEHAYTHCKRRMDMVIDGENGGISKSVNWTGGGGYRFYELAPSLVVEDRFGNPIINKEYNADMLAAAMALHEGFTYAPDINYYWKQGKNENAFIFTTTSHITADYLASIATEMQDGEYLVIACKTYDDGLEKQFKNITIKKIPQVLLGRCEFGKENYNFNIVDVPSVDEED